MLQRSISPLFYRPTTCFGSYQNVEEEMGEALNLSDPWSIALEKELLFSLRRKTGILMHWRAQEYECADALESQFSMEP